MKQFTLSSVHNYLDLTPLTYGVKIGLLIIFTILFVLLIKRKIKKSFPGSPKEAGLSHSLEIIVEILPFSFFYTVLVCILTKFFLGLILMFIEKGPFIIEDISPTPYECCIPFTAFLLAAASFTKDRFIHAFKLPLLVIFVTVISTNIALSIKEIILIRFLYYFYY